MHYKENLISQFSAFRVTGFAFAFLALACLFLHSGCSFQHEIDLSGQWSYRLDPEDNGVENKWFGETFTDYLILPGTLASNNIGDSVTEFTPWLGAIIDKDLWFDEKWEKLLGDQGYKPPFWLAPKKFYCGPAWYQKEILIPKSWDDQFVELELERCHWESRVWLNDSLLGNNLSLSTPHRYILPKGLKAGKNTLTIRIDNSYLIPVGINAHSVSDNTQGNWNGIAGNIKLVRKSPVYIENIKVSPEIKSAIAHLEIDLKNPLLKDYSGHITISTRSENSDAKHIVPTIKVPFTTTTKSHTVNLQLPMGEDFLEWSEFNPAVYTLKAEIETNKHKDNFTTRFGMREIITEGPVFVLNGKKIFLRGTLECSIFPLEGHPPANRSAWDSIFKIVKSYGLNHVRFHSYCPPRAAFEAADHLGVYLWAESSAWATQGLKLGDGEPIDDFVMEEANRIINEYGNHPSFMFMAHGNEADGNKASEYLDKFVTHFKNTDSRRLYTSSAGWPTAPSNQLYSTLQARVQQWTSNGSTYYIEDNPPTTAFNFNLDMLNYNAPFVSHEIGQWCAYPDYKEIEDYTGAYLPSTLQLYKADLEANNMLHLAEDFLYSSGRLQVLGYKADIEASLRTNQMGGFQLLDLHDFPGQGSAIVGVLSALWKEKGYTSPAEFRQFCDTTVVLAAIESLVITSIDTLKAEILVTHFGSAPLKANSVSWQIIDNGKITVCQGEIPFSALENGSAQSLGNIALPVASFKSPAKYQLCLSIENEGIKNVWDLFVFDQPTELSMPENIHYTKIFGSKEEQVLKDGGIVWLDVFHSESDALMNKTGFTPVYWNTLTFHSQPIHTLGILADSKHSAFSLFPTDVHTNWQWWDILTRCKAMITDVSGAQESVLRMIDSYHSNRSLSLISEAKLYEGKILITSIDFQSDLLQRPATSQLKQSLIHYINSDEFDPGVFAEEEKIKKLL